MAERLHPGVYVEEVSSGVRPIEGVSTSTAAFIGETARGIPDMPHYLTSFDEFTRLLGGYAEGDKGLMAHAVESFFANGGQRAYAVRVLPSNAQTGTSPLVKTRKKAAGSAGNLFPSALSFVANGHGAWADALGVEIADSTHFPGEAFQLKVTWTEAGATKVLETFDDVRMDSSREDYVATIVNAGSRYITVTDEFKKATAPTAPALPTAWPIPEEAPMIATRDLANSDKYDVYEGTVLQVQWWNGDAPSGAPIAVTINSAAIGGSFDAQGKAQLDADGLRSLLSTALGSTFVVTATSSHVEIRAKVEVQSYLIVAEASSILSKTLTLTWNDGTAHDIPVSTGTDVSLMAGVFNTAIGSAPLTAWLAGNSIVIRSKAAATHVATITLKESSTTFGTFFAGSAGAALPALTTLDNVHLSINEVRAPGMPSTLRSLGLGGGALARGYSESSPANPAARPAPTAANAPILFAGGSDGTGTTGIADFTGNKAARTGIYAFDPVDINLLAIPGRTATAYLTLGTTYCDGRGNAFFLADGPGTAHGELDITLEEAKNTAANLPQRSKNAAMYYPWVRITDPLGVGASPTRYAPPSGFMAGIYARTDNNRGVWKAPAGIETTVSGALGLQVALVDADQDQLNPVSLNCVRQFPSTGVVVWGARTLSNDAEWRYVSVRRMALFLKESLRRGMQWAVFEPNDEQLWDQIRSNIKSFMLGLFRQGAFQGSTPDEAFRVKCDRSTNPQENVDAGIVTAQVAFAPLKPAEFVVIEISQKSLVS
ncbi:Phage tail sheath protein FI [Minicystis rosea]|nr:Phage tail sheath protein FI [Minicystis rosea]